MAKSEVGVTPGQAQWIVERMIAERRISAGEVRAIIAEMGQEIARLEGQLAALRGIATAPVPQQTTEAAKRPSTKATGHPRGIAGTLAVLLRSIPAAQHAAIHAIRTKKGIRAAIIAARTAAKT